MFRRIFVPVFWTMFTLALVVWMVMANWER